MVQQNYQQNRPQQNRPQQTQHTTAPGTPAQSPAVEPDKLTPEEESRVSAALALGKEQEEQQELNKEKFVENYYSTEEVFKRLMVKSLVSVFEGQNTGNYVKQVIRTWFEELSPEAKAQRLELVEAGKYMLRQVEDIVNDLPILTL